MPRERRLVAAVIYNRLRNRMPLGIDATIRYGLNIPGTESLKQSDLAINSPYNTRIRRGCRRRRSRTRASPRSAPRRTRHASTTSTTSASRQRSPLLHGERGEFSARSVEFGYACS